MGRRRTYTREFKESAVELYNQGGKTRTETAGEPGINPENICRRLRENEEGKKENIRMFPGQGNPRDEELSRLRKKAAGLREADEILKKATAVFAVKKPR